MALAPWFAVTLTLRRFYSVDLRQLTGIDNAGRELLLAMHLAGVRMMEEEIVEDFKWLRRCGKDT